MPMTDTDRLSTPADMAELLKRLSKIMRDIEALPDSAQQRFWEDTSHKLETGSTEDLRLNDVGMRTVTTFYNILVWMCGPKLAEMVNGETKEYYERLLSQMKVATHCEWDAFLNQLFDETKGTDHEGSITATVALRTINSLGCGTLRRVDSESSLLKLTDMRPDTDKERYFSSKDILTVEIART